VCSTCTMAQHMRFVDSFNSDALLAFIFVSSSIRSPTA
jgi:hypothetical protein